MTILHVASDFPGPFAPPGVTRAIETLVVGSRDVARNYVFSPRRTRVPLKSPQVQWSRDSVFSLTFDPLATAMWSFKVGAFWSNLFDEIHENFGDFDLVHSHKLTWEASIGDAFAEKFGLPHIITIRGASDLHARNHWPWTRQKYNSLLQRSSTNLWISQWARGRLSALTSYVPTAKDISFPNAVAEVPRIDSCREEVGGGFRFVTVCRLDHFKQKGIVELLRGFELLVGSGSCATLDLIGSASPATRRSLERTIIKLGLGERVRFLGNLNHDAVLKRLCEYDCLALVSANETFGLVYIEAALAGVPFVFLKNSGVDGYEFARQYGVQCQDTSPKEIARALAEAVCSERRIKLRLAVRNGQLGFLTKEVQSQTYAEILRRACNHD